VNDGPAAPARGDEIAVVVPTRDRPEALGRCLGALASQDLDGIEVVVVDDGSRNRGAVEAVAAAHGARLLRSPGRGPASARNLGAHASTREIVCFTDDDCEPSPAWARTLATAARAAPGRVAAGRTVSPRGAPAAVVASQAITNGLVAASRRSGSLGFAPTCNLAGERGTLTRLPFDPAYPDAAGEDRDWWARAIAAGIEARYEAEAVVVHRPQLDLGGFLRQQLRYGRGAARFRRGAGGERGFGSAGFYLGLVRGGFREGAAVGLLVLAAQVLTVVGLVLERVSLLGGGSGDRA
jgi:glycosyltransferase involved in cell wall biosynthesis